MRDPTRTGGAPGLWDRVRKRRGSGAGRKVPPPGSTCRIPAGRRALQVGQGEDLPAPLPPGNWGGTPGVARLRRGALLSRGPRDHAGRATPQPTHASRASAPARGLFARRGALPGTRGGLLRCAEQAEHSPAPSRGGPMPPGAAWSDPSSLPSQGLWYSALQTLGACSGCFFFPPNQAFTKRCPRENPLGHQCLRNCVRY